MAKCLNSIYKDNWSKHNYWVWCLVSKILYLFSGLVTIKNILLKTCNLIYILDVVHLSNLFYYQSSE